jgi:hypothetical protein
MLGYGNSDINQVQDSDVSDSDVFGASRHWDCGCDIQLVRSYRHRQCRTALPTPARQEPAQ